MVNCLTEQREAARRDESKSGRRNLSLKTGWQGWAKRAAARAGNSIADHPAASLGAAVAVGLAVGWWVKRR